MKKRLVTVLLACLLAATMLPTQVFAASSGEKKLDKVTAATLKQYDTALPKKGKATTKKKLAQELEKLDYKIPGSGKVYFSAYLYFSKGSDGQYYTAESSKSWSKSNTKGTVGNTYSERKRLIAYNESDVGKTQCSLFSYSGKTYTSYSWEKGADTGYKYTGKISSGGTGSMVPKGKKYTTYADQKVMGQKCLVYSYVNGGTTYYEFVSRKNGQTMKSVMVYGSSSSTYVYFDRRYASKGASFFKAPKGVTFSTSRTGLDAAELALYENLLPAA